MDIVIYHKEQPSYCLKDKNKVPMSGSNTAFLHIASALMEKGHSVTMAKDIGEIPVSPKSDILVVSKNPVVAFLYADRAEKTYLWAHDYIDLPSFLPFYNVSFRRRFQNKVTSILCISQFQLKAIKKEFNFPGNFLKLTRNGVDPSLFKNTFRRQNICVYASHPTRGLKALCQIWPLIQEKLPRTKLQIFCDLRNYPALAKKVKGLQNARLMKLQPQEKLMHYFAKAKLLLYPTNCPETSCEVAIEAGAAGLVIITSPIGALKETAKGNIFIRASYGSPSYTNQFVKEVVRLLKDEDAWGKISQENMSLKNYNAWETIADEWWRIFHEDR